MQPQQSYTLKLDIRPGGADNTATVHLCHKWQLSSYDCRQETLRLENNRKWQHFERKIDSGVLGADPWYARRPVKLTLQNSSKSAVDFDNVQLLASDGKDLITNGSFTQRLDHWNFTSDNHLAWHVKALPVAVLFDQGLLGLMALGAVVEYHRKRESCDAYPTAPLLIWLARLRVSFDLREYRLDLGDKLLPISEARLFQKLRLVKELRARNGIYAQ